MDYQTFAPSPNLQSFIKCFWTLKVPKDAPKERQQILPDGCMDMCFIFKDDIKRYTEGDEYILQPRSFILGQITKPFFIEPLGEVDSLGVRFYPNGLHYFVNRPIHSLSNQETELRELFDPQNTAELEAGVVGALSTKVRIHLIEDFLIHTLQQNVNVDELVHKTLDAMFASNGSLGVGEILDKNLSKRRQLERKFSKMIGVSPKQLCRVIRLQSSLKMMLNKKQKNLTTVGLDHEYFDQSHFIKDFKDFTGISPSEFYQDKTFLLSSMIYASE